MSIGGRDATAGRGVREFLPERPRQALGGKLVASERASIAVGGAAGSWARVLVSQAFGSPGAGWPWATFTVNVGGAFLLGYLMARILERLPPSTYRRPLLGTGFCGALTTFATPQLELLTLIRNGHELLAAGYAVASVVCGFVALLCGLWLARGARLA